MKKIGIITICKTDNYGAELQAFATQYALSKMGYEAEIIDYLYYKNWNFKDTKKSRPFICLTIKGRLKYWLTYRVTKWVIDKVCPYFNKKIRQRKQRFEAFHKEKTRMSPCYMSMPNLYHAKMDYDVYVVGSDQVWNPSASSSIEPYFLTFAPKGKKKISYASSFGVSVIEQSLQPRYKELLNNIDIISVREQTGVELVKKIAGKDATVVLDPTLLLTKQDWQTFMNSYPNMPSKYILIYQLSPIEKLMEVAKYMAEKENLPIYRITKRAYFIKKESNCRDIKDAGPAEFLSLFNDASYIVTDSFHGTAFSVNLEKTFFSVLHRNGSKNSRIESLLNQLHLQKRIIYDDMPIEEIKDISLNKNREQLETLRNDSLMYLNDAISK